MSGENESAIAALHAELQALRQEVQRLREEMMALKARNERMEPGRAAEMKAAIEEAIAKAKASRERETVQASDGSEAYAYPHADGIAWGVNAAGTGLNVLRGVRRPDGQDVAVA